MLLYYLQERSIQHSEFWCDSFASCLNYAFLLIFNGSQQHDQRCQLILLKISLVVMRSTSYVKTVVWCLPRLWRELPNVWNNNSDDVIVMTSGLSGLFFNTRSFSTERLCYKLRVNDIFWMKHVIKLLYGKCRIQGFAGLAYSNLHWSIFTLISLINYNYSNNDNTLDYYLNFILIKSRIILLSCH